MPNLTAAVVGDNTSGRYVGAHGRDYVGGNAFASDGRDDR